MATAAIKAGTPEFECKTYEECQRLLKAAAKSVGCTGSALPSVLAQSSFDTVPMRKEGDLIRNPAYDEDDQFKALPKEQQTTQRKRSMMYLQGPNGCLQEEVVVRH